MAKKKPEIPDPREFMQMAIEVMHNSLAEKRKDGKVNPKLGGYWYFPMEP